MKSVCIIILKKVEEDRKASGVTTAQDNTMNDI